MSSSSASCASSNRNGPRLPDCERADIRRTRSRVTSSWEIASSDSRSRCQLGSIVMASTRVHGGEIRLGALQRLGELDELGLVRKGDLEPAGGEAGRKARQALGGDANTLEQRRIELRHLARLRPRARPAGRPLGSANRHAAADDLPGQPAAALLIRNSENRARVALGQLAALDD